MKLGDRILGGSGIRAERFQGKRLRRVSAHIERSKGTNLVFRKAIVINGFQHAN